MFSFLATITEVEASPTTLSEVTNISIGLLIERINEYASNAASFVLPLGMTINMDGTAIMQVIAAMFIAASSGYKVTFMSMAVIAVLALIASVGTPAAPGAGAVILFTILTGMGYTNDAI